MESMNNAQNTIMLNAVVTSNPVFLIAKELFVSNYDIKSKKASEVAKQCIEAAQAFYEEYENG